MIRSLARWALIGAVALLAVLAVFGVYLAKSQDGPIRLVQTVAYWNRKSGPNTFIPRQRPADRNRPDGVRLRSDVGYGHRYPNSFFDIWSLPTGNGSRRPTIVNIHGGGWFIGSKDGGDPLAGADGIGGAQRPTLLLLKAGFNVVNLDYALAPAYRYPVALRQLNQALGFLREHAEEYELDMGNVIIMGTSAGAQMSAQYGLILADREYASRIGIRPTIQRADVKGLILFSPPLRVSDLNWGTDRIFRAYLGTKDVAQDERARELDVIRGVSSSYPPTYITDGNQADTFPRDAQAMARALERHRVDHVFNYYPQGMAKLGHNYTGLLNNPFGYDNFKKTIEFARRRAGLR
ncbi:alpha/beta hydrolase [Sphingomonas sp. OK281]|uniref:alpha/beta hydrolase n=1 Tax=Sphingomonas sp. OK281 TaxID=1881067 RepID=UPI0008E20913|nr:alpha/beta hydrolase [Sphingomonas sp. OK281]SFO36463.1 Acetyl esterase/lipase [Sphingomonas sp. OK281]